MRNLGNYHRTVRAVPCEHNSTRLIAPLLSKASEGTIMLSTLRMLEFLGGFASAVAVNKLIWTPVSGPSRSKQLT